VICLARKTIANWRSAKLSSSLAHSLKGPPGSRICHPRIQKLTFRRTKRSWTSNSPIAPHFIRDPRTLGVDICLSSRRFVGCLHAIRDTRDRLLSDISLSLQELFHIGGCLWRENSPLADQCTK
jgi:hypothetical protein